MADPARGGGSRSASSSANSSGSPDSPSLSVSSASVGSSICSGVTSSPLSETGVAAPKCVVGAMTATWLASRMYVPALSALAPAGVTKVATGIGELRISWTMSRIGFTRPPGVSMSIMTSSGILFPGMLQAAREVICGCDADPALDLEHDHRTLCGGGAGRKGEDGSGERTA